MSNRAKTLDGCKGNLLYYIEPDEINYKQTKHSIWFDTRGFTTHKPVDRAFVYRNLGAQVNVRSSILGNGGRAKEAQTEFVVLLEDAIRQPDLAKSVQRYQLWWMKRRCV